MTRKELLERALAESGSMKEALALVKEWDALASEELVYEREESCIPHVLHIDTFTVDPVNNVLVLNKSHVGKEVNLLDLMGVPDPLATPNYAADQPTKRTRKLWTPREIEIAEKMFEDPEMTISRVGHALQRSDKSVMDGLRNGHIKPKFDPRNPKRRAGSLRASIKRGHKLTNYEEAEAILDNNP